MTLEDPDHDAIIRRALHTTAESIDPGEDGLERIRHRLASPRPATSLLPSLVAWFRLAAIKLLAGLEPVAWLRPVLAISGAATIVVAGAFALSRVQHSITPANSVSTPSRTTHQQLWPASPSTQAVPGAWTPPMGLEPSPTSSSLSGTSGGTGVLPVPTPTPTASAPSDARRPRSGTRSTPSPTPGTPSPTATATPTPTGSGTPTATPTPTDTSTPTATPTPTDTSTPATSPGQSAPAEQG